MRQSTAITSPFKILDASQSASRSGMPVRIGGKWHNDTSSLYYHLVLFPGYHLKCVPLENDKFGAPDVKPLSSQHSQALRQLCHLPLSIRNFYDRENMSQRDAVHSLPALPASLVVKPPVLSCAGSSMERVAPNVNFQIGNKSNNSCRRRLKSRKSGINFLGYIRNSYICVNLSRNVMTYL